MSTKRALARHTTATSDASWDGPANEARLPNTAAALRAAHAWIDVEGDPEAKASYKFIHHEVSADGQVGAANLTGCSAGIAILNGGRGGTNIPSSDRSGVHAHLAGHLRDGDRDVPPLKHYATAIKFAKGTDGAIEGLAIPYGGPFEGKDLDGEFFTAATDFCLDWFTARPAIYDHGLDGVIKTSVVGRTNEYEPTDEGIWAKTQLDKHNRYLTAIQSLVQNGALHYSSGAMPHLVQKDRKTGEITRWPWVELSLTPEPANPDAIVYAVKSSDLLAHLAVLDEGSGSEPFDDQLARVVSEVEQAVERMGKRVDLRATKVGRELSGTNRQWLQSLDERLAALVELRKEIAEALRRTDPEADKAAHAVLADFLINEARLNGVPLQEN